MEKNEILHWVIVTVVIVVVIYLIFNVSFLKNAIVGSAPTASVAPAAT